MSRELREKLFNFREDLDFLLAWRQQVNRRLDLLEETITDPRARAEFRHLKALRDIEDFRHGR